MLCLRSQIATKEKRNTDLAVSNTTLRKQATELQVQKTELTVDITELKAKNAELRAQVDSLTKELVSSEAACAAAKANTETTLEKMMYVAMDATFHARAELI